MIELKYKYKEIRFEIKDNIEIYFLIRNELKYREKMSPKFFIKFADLIINKKDGKVKGIYVSHVNKFVNFRVSKKNKLMSVFMPTNQVIRIVKMLKEMVV